MSGGSNFGYRARGFFNDLFMKGDYGAAGVIFFFVALAIHIFDAWTMFVGFPLLMRVSIYTALAFFAFVIFRNKEHSFDFRSLISFILVSTIIIFLPEIRTYIPNNVAVVYDAVVVVTPLWVIFTFIKCQDNRFIRWCFMAYIFFWITFFLYWFYTTRADLMQGNVTPIDPYKPMKIIGKQVREMTDRAWTATLTFFRDIPGSIEGFWNASMQRALGPYYPTQEEKVKEKVGLFLKNMEATSEHYYYYGTDTSTPTGYDSDPINVWADLEANNLGYGDNEKVEVRVSCGVENLEDYLEEDEIENVIIDYEPKGEFIMEGYDAEQIDCFIEGGLPPGYYDINITVNFNFVTEANVLTYWIDEERYRAITRQGKDVFEEYKLEGEPSSTYTSGPVSIGIGIGNSLVRVGSRTNPRLGVNILKNWYKGKILKVNEFYLLVPRPLELDPDSCSEDITPRGSQNGFNVYSVDVSSSKFEDVKYTLGVSCRFKPFSENVLDPTPITLKYMKAEVRYDYQLYDSIEVEVDDLSDEFEDEKEEEYEEEISEKELPEECSGIVGGYVYDCVPLGMCEPDGRIVDELRSACDGKLVCCKQKTSEGAEETPSETFGKCYDNYGEYLGECQEDNLICPGGYLTGYCKGLPANIRCCVKAKCDPPYESNSCKIANKGCTGEYKSGYCPGPSNVQCCVT